MTALVRAMRTPMPPALRFGMPRDRLDELRALIAQLFGNGEQGAMYIPQPTLLGEQVLYQDAAGTVPVTADGDPVGLVLDLSGNGNHASQSTSAARPVYRTDGTLHWLEFDGVDDWLSTAVISAGSPVTAQITAGVRPTRPADQILAEYGPSNSTAGHFYLTVPERGAYRFLANGVAASISDLASVTHGAIPENAVITGVGDLSQPSKRIRRNGVYGAEALGSTGTFTDQQLFIGSRAGTSLFYASNLYGMVLQFGGTLLEQSISDTEQYVSRKTGVTL